MQRFKREDEHLFQSESGIRDKNMKPLLGRIRGKKKSV